MVCGAVDSCVVDDSVDVDIPVVYDAVVGCVVDVPVDVDTSVV